MARGTDMMARLLPAGGAAVLALTATTWIGRRLQTDSGTVEQAYTLWGMLKTVREDLWIGLLIGIIVVCLFVAVAVLLGNRRPVVSIAASWLAAFATLIIMLNTDAGYSPGPGAWITLVVTLLCAIAGVVVFSLPSRETPAS